MKVIILIPSLSSIEAFFVLLLKRLSEEGVQVTVLCDKPLEGVEWHTLSDLPNVDIRHFPMPRGISPLGLLRSWWQLQRIIQKEQPQIIHAHFSIPALLLAFIRTKALRMATFQGLYHTQNKGLKAQVVGVLEGTGSVFLNRLKV